MEDQNSSNPQQKPDADADADAAFSTPAEVADRDGDVPTTTADGAVAPATEFMPSPDRRMSTNYCTGSSSSSCGGNGCKGWNDRDYINSFPPGYRFCPTDLELVYYLKKKIKKAPLPPNIIRDVNLYAYNPANLVERCRRNGEKEWYFFTPRDRKYLNGSRPNRAAGDGYWKATGPDKNVIENKMIVGSKKVLVFYFGRPPNGTKTNWIMHEYMVKNGTSRRIVSRPRTDMRLDDWVLCRIYEKIQKRGGNGGTGGGNSGNGSNCAIDDGNGSSDGSGSSNGTQGNDHNAMNPIENHGTRTGYINPKDDQLLSSVVGSYFHQPQTHMNGLRPGPAPVQLSTRTGRSVVGRHFHQPQPYMNGFGPGLAPVQLSTQTGGPGNGPALCNPNGGGAGLNPVFSGHNGGFGFGLGPVLVNQNGGVGVDPMSSTQMGFGASNGFGVPHIPYDPFHNSGKHAFVQAPTYRAQPISVRPPPPHNIYPQCDDSDSNILKASKQETNPGDIQMEEGFNGYENYDPVVDSYLIVNENDPSSYYRGTAGGLDEIRNLSNQEPKFPPEHGSN